MCCYKPSTVGPVYDRPSAHRALLRARNLLTACLGRCIVPITFPKERRQQNARPILEGGRLLMRFRFLFGVSLIFTFTCGMAMAQGTAQISGTVMDPSGARLPGAEVTATQTATGV